MKTTRSILALTAVLTVVTGSFAQSVNFVGISKVVDFEQTTNSAPSLATNPYSFEAFIDGVSLTSSFPLNTPATNTVTTPGGTISSFNYVWDSGDNMWGYNPGTTYSGITGGTGLNDALANGSYSFSLNNNTVNFSLSLTGDNYVTAPLVTTNLGTWSGNKLVLSQAEAAMALTISSGTFSGFNSGIDRVGINLYGINNGYYAPEAQTFTLSSLDMNLVANALTPGGTYKVEVDFNNIVDYLQNGNIVLPNYSAALNSLGGDVKAFAMYTTVTTFEIQVIPEPSTSAAIFGVLALAGGMIHRRRRRG